MPICSVDHTRGKHGRDAVLVDTTGAVVFGMHGCEAVLNERGKVGWYLKPPLMANLFNGRIVDLCRMKSTADGGSLHPATVHKEPLEQSFVIEVHDPKLGALSFEPVTSTSPPDPIDGSSPPDGSVWDLLVDGRPAIRHWFTVGSEYELVSSRFEIYESPMTLPELVLLCTARVLVWRPRRATHGPQWNWD